ncbi:MAG TPA: protein kinase [Candidatus Acidoferrum sp.]
MSDLWKRCEGQLVDEKFLLRQFLGNTNHSAVFLSESAGSEPRKVILKFISAEIPAPEERLATWNKTSGLDHPHIVRLMDSGRCSMAGLELLYVVMEHADEELSQFLPERALTAEEARDLLGPLVEALGYLHGKELAHGHIKPSNICAVAEQMKLSCDSFLAIGQARETHRDLDVYDAPENSSSPSITASAAADIWSLGITLVEALTQQAPALPLEDSAEIALPETLPSPFLEIAQHCLVRDPARRWSITEIAAHLNPVPFAAAAIAGASSSSAAWSSESAAIPLMNIPLAALRTVPVATPREVAALPKLRETNRQAETTIALPSYVIPLVLFSALVLIVIVTFPKFFRHLSATNGSGATSSVSSSAKASPNESGRAAAAKSATRTAVESSPKPATEQKQSASEVLSAKSVPRVAAAPAKVATSTVSFVDATKTPAVTKSSAASPERGDVLEQVVPRASPKALATIHGTVRVVVGVHVDAAGNVLTAELDSPGPSKYFADLALQAAHGWQFASPVTNGRSLASQWAIRFEFSPTGAVAIPTQKLP